MERLKIIAPITLAVLLVIGIYAAGLQRYASFATLGQQQAALRALAADHPVGAPLAYMLLYAAVVAVSLPVGVLLTVAGGLLFGVAFGTIYAVTGAGTGATLVFLLARTALGGLLSRRASALLDRVRPGLERDGFSYLLVLRLLPVVPFWIVNLAPALVGMRLAPYAAATFLGIIPATSVFVSLGAGLGDTLAAGRRPDLTALFGPGVLTPLLGLAALALVPVAWRAWRRARHA